MKFKFIDTLDSFSGGIATMYLVLSAISIGVGKPSLTLLMGVLLFLIEIEKE